MVENRTYKAASSTNGSSQFPCGGDSQSMTTGPLVLWTTLHCVVAILVVLSNALVVMSFIKNSNLHTRTNYLIMSLALADLLVGLVSVPGWLVLLYKEDEFCFNWYVVVMEIWYVFEILGGVGSIFHLMALTWDRLCAIVWPLRHRSYNKRKYVAIICLIWSCAALVSGLSVLGNRRSTHVYNVSVICLCFFLPLILIFIAQGITLFTIKQNSAKFHHSTSLKRDVRAAKAIAIMIGLFLIGWLPFFSLGLVKYTHGDLPALSAHAICAVKLLQYGNSLFNPILYGQKFPEFRKAYIKILCHKKAEEDLSRPNATNTFRMTAKFQSTTSSSKDNCNQRLLPQRPVNFSVRFTNHPPMSPQTERSPLSTTSGC